LQLVNVYMTEADRDETGSEDEQEEASHSGDEHAKLHDSGDIGETSSGEGDHEEELGTNRVGDGLLIYS
jgi:hypothetical protein